MSDIQIRRAGPADIPAIIELADGLFQEDAGTRDPSVNLNWPREEGPAAFAAALERDSAHYLLAFDGDQPIGYLGGAVPEPSSFRRIRVAEIRALFVRAPYRGRGIGERLVATFLAWARAQEADRVAVSAFAANTGAIRFYERVGFTPHEIILEQPLLGDSSA